MHKHTKKLCIGHRKILEPIVAPHPPNTPTPLRNSDASCISRGGYTMAFMLDGSNSDVALPGRISRRSLLGIAGMLGVGAPFALAGGAHAVTVFGRWPSAS